MKVDIENQHKTNEYVQEIVIGIICLGTYFVLHMTSVSSYHMAIAFNIPIQNVSIYFTKLCSSRTLFMIIGSMIDCIVSFNTESKYVSLVSFSLMVISRIIMLLLLYLSSHLSLHSYIILNIEAFFFGYFQISFTKSLPSHISIVVFSNNLSGFLVAISQSILDLFLYKQSLFLTKIMFFIWISINLASLASLSYYLFCIEYQIPISFKDILNDIKSSIESTISTISFANQSISSLIEKKQKIDSNRPKIGELIKFIGMINVDRTIAEMKKINKIYPFTHIPELSEISLLVSKITQLKTDELSNKISSLEIKGLLDVIYKLEEIEETNITSTVTGIITYLPTVSNLDNEDMADNYAIGKKKHRQVSADFSSKLMDYIEKEKKVEDMRNYFKTNDPRAHDLINELLSEIDPVKEMNKLNITVNGMTKYYRGDRKWDYSLHKKNHASQIESVKTKLTQAIKTLGQIRDHLTLKVNEFLMILIGTIIESATIKHLNEITDSINELRMYIENIDGLQAYIGTNSMNTEVLARQHDMLRYKINRSRANITSILQKLSSALLKVDDDRFQKTMINLPSEINLLENGIHTLSTKVRLYPGQQDHYDNSKLSDVLPRVKKVKESINTLEEIIGKAVCNELKTHENPINQIDSGLYEKLESKLEKMVSTSIPRLYYSYIFSTIGVFFKDFIHPGLIPYGLLLIDRCHLINKMTTLFSVSGCLPPLILHHLFNNFEYLEKIFCYSSIIVIPELFVFLSSLIAVHTKCCIFKQIPGSRVYVLIMSILLFTCFKFIESIGYICLANYAFYQAKDHKASMSILSYYDIFNLLCRFIFSKISLGYIITKTSLGYYKPGDYYTNRNFMYWLLNTFKNSFVDMALDFKLNIRQYI